MIGVMSTPPMGGTIFLRGAKKGSVGQEIRIKGKRLRLICGYQVRTILKMKRMVINMRKMAKVQLIRMVEVMVVSAKVKFCQEPVSEF